MLVLLLRDGVNKDNEFRIHLFDIHRITFVLVRHKKCHFFEFCSLQ